MSIKNFTNSAGRVFGRAGLKLQKYSPQILTGVGIASGIVSGVVACKATLKVEPILDDMRKDVAVVKENKELYNDKAYAQTLSYSYTKGVVKVVKLYAPAASLAGVSIACIVSAQGIMNRRNAALAAAYAAVEKGFADYRKRVAEAYGKEREEEIRYDITSDEVHDTKAGKVETVKRANDISIYARYFDENNDNWSPTPEYNLMYLRSQQNHLNDLLVSRGHVFLNEAYDMLGIPRTKAGQVVGWLYQPGVPGEDDGDNYIDLGFYRDGSETVRDFVNGLEKAILLDFNVDGVIYDRI